MPTLGAHIERKLMPDPIETPEGEEPDENETPEGEELDEDDSTPGEDALGDPGKRALDATKAKYKAERTKRLALEQQLRDATAPKGDAPDPDTIRADAIREATEKANVRIIRASVKGEAAAFLRNPADALALLPDLTVFDVDDDGEVDAEEIKTALKDLIAERPYLAIDQTNPQRDSKKRIPEVSADPAHKQSTPVSHADKVKAAKAAGDWQTVIALETDLLETK